MRLEIMTKVNLSSISGRLILAVVIVGLLAAGWWWAAQPKPIPVVFKTVDRGKVESTISNTRAGTVESCQRAKLATSMGFQVAFAVAGAAYLLSAMSWSGIPDTQGKELE